jgi:hypothetical protein
MALRGCVMKWLTVSLLLFSVFGPTVFAQSVEQAEDPFRVFSGWLEVVKGAERNYKNKNGRYGDLAALRKAHLLDRLVFESDSSAETSGKADANFVRKRTLFQVTVSKDGQHFRAVIGVKCTSTMIDADDMGNKRYGMSDEISCPPIRLPLLDSPEGPIISVAR